MVRGCDRIGLIGICPSNYPVPNLESQARSSVEVPERAVQHAGYVMAIFAGALAANVPWCTTWAAQFLSVNGWCQVAVEHKRVARWAHNAIQQAYTITPMLLKKWLVSFTNKIFPELALLPRRNCPTVAYQGTGIQPST